MIKALATEGPTKPHKLRVPLIGLFQKELPAWFEELVAGFGELFVARVP